MIDATLPTEFLEKCSEDERAGVESWWRGLNNDSRSDVCMLLDRRNDSRAFVFCEDEQGNRAWHRLPLVDEDLPSDNPDDYEREWQLEHFEHLLAHPELMIASDAVIRTFHICTAHPAARQVVENGELAKSFSCPVGAVDCPIAKFAAKLHRRARLVGVEHKSNRTTWICE